MRRKKAQRHAGKPCRAGSLMIEAVVVLAVVAVLGVIIAQCLTWSVRERGQLASRQAALELSANALEEARALPFEALTKPWADARTIPSESAELLPEGKLLVTLQPGPTPRTRRVQVEVRWGPESRRESVSLATVLSDRVTKKGVGQP